MEQEVKTAPQDSHSDNHKRTSTSREEYPKSLKTASFLDTQVTTLTAEDTMDAEQEDDQSEGRQWIQTAHSTVLTTRGEICGRQAATTNTSNIPRNETDVAMEGT
jgi:hypothetical protein